MTHRFATSGGLYSLNACGHPIFGAITAWVGVFSCLAGVTTTPLLFAIFLQSLLGDFGLHCPPAGLLGIMILCTAASGFLAWRDTSVSARFVLAIEGFSLVAILALVTLVLVHQRGSLIDLNQFTLRGVSLHQIAEGIVLGLGAYGGFEASCSFGLEARKPHQEIAHALIGSIIGAGILFVLCSYALNLGFHGINIATTHSSNPWSDLALLNGSSLLSYLVQIGILASVFSMFVTNFNVWSRMLLTLSREELLPRWLGRIDSHTRTPGLAILSSVLFGIALQAMIVFTGYATRNLYTLICALSGYWVTITYILVCCALIAWLRREKRLRWWHLAMAAVGALPLIGSIILSAIPLPPFPDDIGVILFVLSSIAVAVQLILIALHRPALLERIGNSIRENAESASR
jgi:amino acid transporter